MTNGSLPEHFSITQADKYSKCGLAYKYAYIDRLTPKFSEKLWFGGTLHAAIASWLQLRREGKSRPVEEIYGVNFDARAIGADLWKQLGGEEEYKKEKAEGLALFKLFLAFLEPLLENQKIVYIEELMTLAYIGKAVEKEGQHHVYEGRTEVIGRIDFATEDTVFDWKTTGRAKQIDLTVDLQMQMYALGYYNATGHQAKNLCQVQLVRAGKKSEMNIVPLVIPVMWEHQQEAVKDMEAIMTLIEVGKQTGVWKRERNSWYCSEKYCDYWNICNPPF